MRHANGVIMPVWVDSVRARCQGPFRLMVPHIALAVG
jgi:hypothetical protein